MTKTAACWPATSFAPMASHALLADPVLPVGSGLPVGPGLLAEPGLMAEPELLAEPELVAEPAPAASLVSSLAPVSGLSRIPLTPVLSVGSGRVANGGSPVGLADAVRHDTTHDTTTASFGAAAYGRGRRASRALVTAGIGQRREGQHTKQFTKQFTAGTSVVPSGIPPRGAPV